MKTGILKNWTFDYGRLTGDLVEHHTIKVTETGNNHSITSTVEKMWTTVDGILKAETNNTIYTLIEPKRYDRITPMDKI